MEAEIILRGSNPTDKTIISHVIRSRQPAEYVSNDQVPRIDSADIHKILKGFSFPSPGQQKDFLIHAIYQTTPYPGGQVVIQKSPAKAIICAESIDEIAFAVLSLYHEGLIETHYNNELTFKALRLISATISSHGIPVILTPHGYQYIENLSRGIAESNIAFMAMKFDDQELDNLFLKHIRPAVEKTGFGIRRLDEDRRSGLIDDKMRVNIRTSAFVLADLTHGNNGAYWEAGYAEGIGKPVIYLCEKSVFDNPVSKPHFDTNHHLTIKWDKKNPVPAMEELKATIRETLPHRAKLID